MLRALSTIAAFVSASTPCCARDDDFIARILHKNVLCWATSSITVYIAKKIVSPFACGRMS
jgi:hypothetical protein